MRCHGWHIAGLLLLGWAFCDASASAQQPAFAAASISSVLDDTSNLSDQDSAEQVELVGATQRLPAATPAGGAGSGATLNDLRRRIEAIQAETDALRAEPASFFARPRSTDSLTSYQTEQKGVEDRIANLERGSAGRRDSYPIARLSGFFNLDSGEFSQSPASQRTLGDIQNGTGFRRTRLQALGKLTEHTNFSIEMDFANAGRPSFFDVWGEQTNFFSGNVRIGNFRQPATMDSWTSVRHMEFLERSAPFQAFDPFRRVGAMNWWVSESQRTLIAASVFATGWTLFNNTAAANSATGAAGAAGASTQYSTMTGDSRIATELGDNGGVAFGSRATHLIYYDDPSGGRYLMHVGAGYTFAQIGGGGVGDPMYGTPSTSQTYRATTIPESFVGDQGGNSSTFAGTPNVLDTGRYLAHNYSFYHVEWAGNAGSFNWQAEAMGTVVDQYAGPLVYYGGAYAQVGYFLTGEAAGYNKLTGALDYNCVPFREFMGLGPGRGMCGWGAWEVAARWSYLDLQSNRINPANYQLSGGAVTNASTDARFSEALPGGPSANTPNPGVLNESTVALNWYWSQFSRVQFNWIHNMLSSQYRGYSQMDLWTARYQIEF